MTDSVPQTPPRERRPFPVWASVLIGLALLAPTATMGFYIDDYFHQIALDDPDGVPGMRPWALYDFGTAADWEYVDGMVGSVPWWTGEEWQVRFLRPVTSLALAGQHALFGGWATGYHLVGMALFAALILLVRTLYSRLGLSAQAAGTGALILAVSSSALYPAGWPANLNSLLVAVFSVMALIAVVPREGARARPLLGATLAALAAFSKESGVVALVLVALALMQRASGEQDPARRRATRAFAALPLVLVAAYVVLFLVGGYGTNCLFYSTPWEDPGAAIANLALLLSAGPLSLVGPIPLDVVTVIPESRAALTLIGLVFGLPLTLWIARRVRGHRGWAWLAVWTVAFLATQVGAPPSDRLLFVPAIGAAGLLGVFFDANRSSPSRWLLVRIAVGLLWVSVVLVSGLLFLLGAFGMHVSADYLRESSLETDVGDPALGHRDLVVLQAESQVHLLCLPTAWSYESNDRELTFWMCQIGNRPVRWTRVDKTTFDLESLGKPFLTNFLERLYLTDEPEVTVGDTWSTPLFDVEALTEEGGAPTRLRFRMRRSLDDATLRFLRPEAGRLVPQRVPAIGASIEFPEPVRVGPYLP